jgi:hypothetical protein
MTRDQLSRSFRSFLDRLYVLQRFKLFIKPRVLPSSPPVQARILRCQIVDLIQKYHRFAVSTDSGAPSAHASLWQLDVRRSLIPNAGDGVFVRGCSVQPRTLLTLYPGQTLPTAQLHDRARRLTLRQELFTCRGSVIVPTPNRASPCSLS